MSMTVRFDSSGQRAYIRFSFPPPPEKDQVKALGARFDGGSKTWALPLTDRAKDWLGQHGSPVPKSLAERIAELSGEALPEVLDRADVAADPIAQGAILDHPALSPEMLRSIAAKTEPAWAGSAQYARARIVDTTQDPQELVRIATADPTLLYAAAKKPAFPADQLLALGMTAQWAERVVADPAASPKTLAEAWTAHREQAGAQWLAAAAQHPNAPPSVLEGVVQAIEALPTHALGAAPNPIGTAWNAARSRLDMPPMALAEFAADKQSVEAAAREAAAAARLAHSGEFAKVPAPEGLAVTLYAYQREGVAFLMNHPKALLLDEQGVGKTYQFLIAANASAKAIILSPTSACWQTAGAIRELWPDVAPSEIVVLESGSGAQEARQRAALANARWVVCPYSLMQKYRDSLLERAPYALVADEAHLLKSPTAQRTMASRALVAYADRVILATGTPLMNDRPEELYPLLSLIGNTLGFRGEVELKKTYREYHLVQGRGRVPTHYEYGKPVNLVDLKGRLAAVAIRREKAAVLPELPPKQLVRVPVNVPAGRQREYALCATDFLAWRTRYRPNAEPLTPTAPIDLMVPNALREIAARGKADMAQEWIANFLASSSSKLLVFSDYRAPLDALLAVPELAGQGVAINGDITGSDREAARGRFQEDPAVRLCVMTTQSGGVGLTLTAADSVLFLNYPWQATIIAQAFDRIHRIGQTAESVTAYFLEMNAAKYGDTIDQAVYQLVLGKQEVADAVLGKSSTDLHAAELAGADAQRGVVKVLGLTKTITKAQRQLAQQAKAADTKHVAEVEAGNTPSLPRPGAPVIRVVGQPPASKPVQPQPQPEPDGPELSL